MAGLFGDDDLVPEVPREVPDLKDFGLEVPTHLDVLPDGRETVVIGDPEGRGREGGLAGAVEEDVR